MSGPGAGSVVCQEQADARGRSQLSIHARARTQDTSRGSRGSHIIARSWEAGDRGRAPARKRREGLAVYLPRGAAPHPGALSCEDVTTQGSGGPRPYECRSRRTSRSFGRPGNLFCCGRPSYGSARAAGDEATVCQAKRLALIEDRNVRPRDCVPVHGRVRACSRSTAQQTATTAVGLELGSEEGLDDTIGFDGERSRDPPSWRDRYATARTVAAGCCLRAQRSSWPGRPSHVHTDRRSSRRRSIAPRRPVPGPAATGRNKPLRAFSLESFGHPGQPGQT